MYDAQCTEIDDFIAAYKTLDGLMPEWIDHFSRDFQVRWAILDTHQIQHGELCVTCDRSQHHISVAALHRQRMFYRLDMVPPAERHHNPLGAHALGLPPFVFGPHVHGWIECREYVRINGFGQLPFRRQIQGSVTSLSDALAWVAQDIGINVTAEQRVCDMPQKGLFD